MLLLCRRLVSRRRFYVTTMRWKVSVHTATVAGVLVMLVWLFGPVALVASPMLLLPWSRVRSVAIGGQTIAGRALGDLCLPWGGLLSLHREDDPAYGQIHFQEVAYVPESWDG